jgi:hypothetical protein
MLSKSIFDTEKGEGIDSNSNDVIIVRDSRHSSGTCTSSTSTTTSTCTTTESDAGDGAGKGESTEATVTSPERSREHSVIYCPFDIQSVIDRLVWRRSEISIIHSP